MAFPTPQPLQRHKVEMSSTRSEVGSSSASVSASSRTWIQHPHQAVAAAAVTTTSVAVPAVSMHTARRKSRQKIKPMPVTGYDSSAIEEYYDRRPFQVAWRLNSLGFPLLGMYLLVV